MEDKGNIKAKNVTSIKEEEGSITKKRMEVPYNTQTQVQMPETLPKRHQCQDNLKALEILPQNRKVRAKEGPSLEMMKIMVTVPEVLS